MEDFKLQIDEDIKEIQENYIDCDSRLKNEDYAFNFWVLQKLYSIDEDIIPNYIIEGSDRGIDCFYFNEDRKELFLIQNKHWQGMINYSEIIEQFLKRPLEFLRQGRYTRSKELQDVFTKYKEDSDFQVNLHYYITSNSEAYSYIKEKFADFKYPEIKGIVNAEFFALDDIEEKYYTDRKKQKKNFEIELRTIKKQTRIDISPNLVSDLQLIRSSVMPVNVNDIYELIKKAKKEGYELFEENIRDFIGENSAINKEIINTLKDKKERINFIYYNNGITIIADDITTEKQENIYHENRIEHTNKSIIKNPQIVNGCQTVNSIYYALNMFQGSDYERKVEYKNTFVMVKLLQLSNETDKDTYLKIVNYNNSQNAIKLKDFVAAQEIFTNLKKDLREYGFFLLTRQSDINDFKTMTRAEKEKLFAKAKNICDKLDLDIKTNDIKIDITKLLQTISAYYIDGYFAYVKKQDLLKKGSSAYNKIVEILREITTQQKLSIYLYYLKAEKERKASEEKINPIPYYLLTILKGLHSSKFVYFNEDKKFIDTYRTASRLTKVYAKFASKIEPQYNKMIKQKMHQDLIGTVLETAEIN